MDDFRDVGFEDELSGWLHSVVESVVEGLVEGSSDLHFESPISVDNIHLFLDESLAVD